MEVGVRFKAYWCVRDFDSPIWWQLQVSLSQPKISNILYDDIIPSHSECYHTKNRGSLADHFYTLRPYRSLTIEKACSPSTAIYWKNGRHDSLKKLYPK